MWMNWIIEPKATLKSPNTSARRQRRNWPAKRPRTPNFCSRIPRGRTQFLEARLLLENPARRLRERRGRLQGLQRLGPGLDLDQGLKRSSDRWRLSCRRGGRRAAGSPISSTAAHAFRSGRSWPAPSAGWSSATGLARPPPVAAFWSVNPVSGELVRKASPSKTSKSSRTNRSTGHRRPNGPDRGVGHDHRRDPRLPDRLLHGQGRQPPRQGGAGDRRPDPALVELSGQGSVVADDALPRGGSSPGFWNRSA